MFGSKKSGRWSMEDFKCQAKGYEFYSLAMENLLNKISVKIWALEKDNLNFTYTSVQTQPGLLQSLPDLWLWIAGCGSLSSSSLRSSCPPLCVWAKNHSVHGIRVGLRFVFSDSQISLFTSQVFLSLFLGTANTVTVLGKMVIPRLNLLHSLLSQSSESWIWPFHGASVGRPDQRSEMPLSLA